MTTAERSWLRRARPLLGTLVEMGVVAAPGAEGAVHSAFDLLADVQRQLSRFEPDSDIGRFNAIAAGGALAVRAETAAVLAAAAELQDRTDGLFDISLGSGPNGWRCDGGLLHKLMSEVRLDLGGIGKGHAVDCAVQALMAHGCTAGWVNAGGDLRAFGDVAVPVALRDELHGGVRPFASLREGAFATSHFSPTSRSKLARAETPALRRDAHVSVAAPLCVWADALTKVVALSGDATHPVLGRYGAQAWLH